MNFLEITKKEIKFFAVRSSGPGGQNVNKVSSAAQLFWNYSTSQFISEFQKSLIATKLYNHINSENEIYIRSDEFRDLERNKERCKEKLQKLLEMAFFKPKPRKKTKPSYSSKVKRKESKQSRSKIKKMRGKID